MRKRINKEFENQSCAAGIGTSNTQAGIERDIDISQGIISRWKRELLVNGEQTFPGKGHLKPDDNELRCLKREGVNVFSGYP